MTKKIIKQFVFLMLCAVAFVIGISGGIKWRNYKNSKTVVFRISRGKDMMNYDMKTAINYLQYQYEKKGYDVLPWRYPGAFYHLKGDDALINVFIRDDGYFYDTRMNKDAFNIYYIHHFFVMYAEELNGYDYYLSSQKNFKKALPRNTNIGYLGVGGIPHEKLIPQYKYDILYIGENDYLQKQEDLNRNYRVKYYTDLGFGQLTEKQKEDMFAQTRLVIYDTKQFYLDDIDYIPYAVYDIISYGRPLLTNTLSSLYEIFGEDVCYYKNAEDMLFQIRKILAENDEIREERSNNAYKKFQLNLTNAEPEFPKKYEARKMFRLF